MTTIYYVCHGPDAVHYVELDSGSNMSSGQTNIEQFDTEAEAVARATELGYVFPTEEEEET
jgi:hypothetical protein